MNGRVVHVNDNVEGAVYIGRAMPRKGLKASPFANPYKVGPKTPRLEAVALFAFYMFEQPELWSRLPDLRNKPLACWCRHDGEDLSGDNLCHGDVLLELLDRHTDEELRYMGE